MKKILIVFLLFSTIIFGSTITGNVIKVYDGDTIIIQGNRDLIKEFKKFKIRFYGIDTPEIKQSYGIEARNYLRKLIDKKIVKVIYKKKDRYGRYIGKVYLNNNYINLEMVKKGQAWWFQYFAKYDTDLKNAQIQAQKENLGLWKDKNAIAPWIWRKKNRYR